MLGDGCVLSLADRTALYDPARLPMPAAVPKRMTSHTVSSRGRAAPRMAA